MQLGHFGLVLEEPVTAETAKTELYRCLYSQATATEQEYELDLDFIATELFRFGRYFGIDGAFAVKLDNTTRIHLYRVVLAERDAYIFSVNFPQDLLALMENTIRRSMSSLTILLNTDSNGITEPAPRPQAIAPSVWSYDRYEFTFPPQLDLFSPHSDQTNTMTAHADDIHVEISILSDAAKELSHHKKMPFIQRLLQEREKELKKNHTITLKNQQISLWGTDFFYYRIYTSGRSDRILSGILLTNSDVILYEAAFPTQQQAEVLTLLETLFTSP